MKVSRIKDFKKDTQIQGFFLVREKHRRTTRTDRPFLQLVLQDRTGSIEAKIWEDVPAFEKSFEHGDAVVARGRVSSFRDKLQLEVEDIGQATPEKHGNFGFDPLDLLPSTTRSIERMWSDIMQRIEKMKSEPLRKLVDSLYRKHEDILKTHPASMTLHHAVYGGFLEHHHSISALVPKIARHYNLDADLLLTGVLLHDIGKIRELFPVSHPGYTDEGQLIGHIVLGHEMVREAIKEIKGFPEDLKLKIEHMVLSHQGKYEWQSPKRPKFPEALMLHLLDEMDARMDMLKGIIEKDPEPGNWTNRFNYFRSALLKGDLGEDDTQSK